MKNGTQQVNGVQGDVFVFPHPVQKTVANFEFFDEPVLRYTGVFKRLPEGIVYYHGGSFVSENFFIRQKRSRTVL